MKNGYTNRLEKMEMTPEEFIEIRTNYDLHRGRTTMIDHREAGVKRDKSYGITRILSNPDLTPREVMRELAYFYARN